MGLGDYPAYPCNYYMRGVNNDPIDSRQYGYGEPGMTIRQAYAMAAMQGLLGNPDLDANEDEIAKESFFLADAMIAFEEQEHERRKAEENAKAEASKELGDQTA